ncbi:MAG TPA: hypothetical protein VGC34_13150 [Steroidobacteraceae bacterium]
MLRRTWLALLPPLLLFLLLLFLGGVMSDGATGRRAQYGMMTGQVSRNRAYGRAFDAALRNDRLRANR